MAWLIIIVLILVLVYTFRYSIESFSVNRRKIQDEIINNQAMFDDYDYTTLKNNFTWLDPVIYRGVKSLRKNKMNVDYNSLSDIV